MPNYLRLLTPRTTVLFVCDVQECFRPSVYGFRELCTSISKMVRAAAITEMHVLSTEQNYKYDQDTAKEIGMKDLPERLNLGVFNKDKFSMVDDSVRDVLKKHKFEAVILTGTEAHACVLQTAIDLLREGVDVFVLADAVSSCNRAEIPIALEALRQAGCQITTTESILFRVMNDASDPKFKEFADLVKEHKEHSKQSLKTFLGEMEEH